MKMLLVMMMMMMMRMRMRKMRRMRRSRRDRRKTDIYKRTLFSVYFILFEISTVRMASWEQYLKKIYYNSCRPRQIIQIRQKRWKIRSK